MTTYPILRMFASPPTLFIFTAPVRLEFNVMPSPKLSAPRAKLLAKSVCPRAAQAQEAGNAHTRLLS